MEYIFLLLSLLGVIYGADNLVNGAVGIAKQYRVSDFVIGATIVGIGTSIPEFVVSLIGAIQGNSDVAIGNVVGSNIFNILCILGLTSIIYPVAIEKSNLKFEVPVCIAVSILFTLLTFNLYGGESILGRFDGLILFGVFVWYMVYSFYKDKKEHITFENNNEYEENKNKLFKNILITIGGLALLVFSCDLFVDSAVTIAKNFGISDAVISLTLIACGTSMPELAASVVAAAKKNTQLALGNIIGSNIFNITFILGLSSQVMPLTSTGITFFDYLVMILAAIVPLLCMYKMKIDRFTGGLMLSVFVLYTLNLLNVF